MKKLLLLVLPLLALIMTPASLLAQEIEVKGTIRLKGQSIDTAAEIHSNGDAILKSYEELRKAWIALRNAQEDLEKKSGGQQRQGGGFRREMPSRQTEKEDKKTKELQDVVTKKMAAYEVARAAYEKEMANGVVEKVKIDDKGKFTAKTARTNWVTYSSAKEAKEKSRGFVWCEKAVPFLEINEANKKEDYTLPPEVEKKNDTGGFGGGGYPPRGR